MPTPSMMLPLETPLPAAPARPAAQKDSGKAVKKPSGSFGSVLSAKVGQDKPEAAAKAASGEQQDQAAGSPQGAATAQPMVPGGMAPVIVPPVLAGTSDAGTVDAVSALGTAATAAQAGQAAGQTQTALPAEAFPAAQEATAQPVATEATPAKPAFLAILSMAAKEQGTPPTTGANADLPTVKQPAAPQQPEAAAPVAVAGTDAKTAVEVRQSGQAVAADAQQQPDQLASATITEEAQKLMPVAGEKKQAKPSGAVAPEVATATAGDAGKEQAVPAATALTNGAGQKKDGQGAEPNLTAGGLQDAQAEGMPDKAKAAETPSFTAVLDSQAAHTGKSVADSAATTAGTPAKADAQNVFGQIVDQAKLITRAQNSEMVIKLKPEHLGELTLKVAIEGGTVSASFHSANSEVRAAIEATLPQLKQELSNQGLKVDYVGVYASLDQFSPRDHRSTAQQQTIKLKRRDGEAFEEAVEAAGTVQPGTDTAVDYRV
ncbi:MAG TPA: flagellar hook-length control protein FliK [Selenomonadales bacterium]|nr:flagellar hook-length control protein FliK [Selenomonadales bacterium]